ncbi:hypothetical protein ACU7M0_38930, partial [Burkholderia cenocepacia]
AATGVTGPSRLNPSHDDTAQMDRDGQALFIHAIESPYRDRSHFDGQNVLETGGGAPYQVKDGWLNRLAALLPATRDNAIAFAPTVPLALRGEPVQPAVLDLVRRPAARFEHVLAVEMRAVAIRRGDRMDEQRLTVAVHLGGLR